MGEVIEAINPLGYAEALKVDSSGHLIISGGSGGGSGGATEAKQDTMLVNQTNMKSSLTSIDSKMSGIGDGKVLIQGDSGGGSAVDLSSTSIGSNVCLDVNVANTGNIGVNVANTGNIDVNVANTGNIDVNVANSTIATSNTKITTGQSPVGEVGDGGAGVLQQVLIYGKKNDNTLQPLECNGDRLLVDVVELAASGPITNSTALPSIQVCGSYTDTSVSPNVNKFRCLSVDQPTGSLNTNLRGEYNDAATLPTVSSGNTNILQCDQNARLEVKTFSNDTGIATTTNTADDTPIPITGVLAHDTSSNTIRSLTCNNQGELLVSGVSGGGGSSTPSITEFDFIPEQTAITSGSNSATVDLGATQLRAVILRINQYNTILNADDMTFVHSADNFATTILTQEKKGDVLKVQAGSGSFGNNVYHYTTTIDYPMRYVRFNNNSNSTITTSTVCKGTKISF